MAPLKGTAARLLLNDYDLSCSTSQLNVEANTGEYDHTSLCSDAQEFVPGLNGGSISLNGFFETASTTTGEEYRLYDALAAATKIVAAIFDYTNLPAAAYVIEGASNFEMTHTAPYDGLVALSGSFRGTSGLRRGLAIYYQKSLTATGGSTAVQIPGTLVSSTGRVVVFLHSHTGSLTTATVALESSANGSTGWASEATLNFTADGAKAAAFTTPAGAYFRLNVTSMGGTTGLVLTCVVIVDNVTG